MIIYKTTNKINGKIYIGKDTHNDPNYFGSGVSLTMAIKKYGKEHFVKEVIESCSTLEELNKREQFWINKFNSTNKKIGYNLTEGGEGGNTRKFYTKTQKELYIEKMSKSMKTSEKYNQFVEKVSGVARPKHSEKLKELYASGKMKSWNIGKITPEDVRLKISNSNLGKTLTKEQKEKIAKSKYKPVSMYDLDNNYIKTFNSIKHASDEMKIGRDSIYGCCVGKYKQGAGYIWKYETK